MASLTFEEIYDGIYRGQKVECDPNLKNKYGVTLLMRASVRGHINVVKFLVGDLKADINLKTIHGDTALVFASRDGNLDVVKFLIVECGANTHSALKWAVIGLQDHVVDYLVLNKLVDVNEKSGVFQSTPLISAVMWRRFGGSKIVNILVENGADPSIEDTTGRSAAKFNPNIIR